MQISDISSFQTIEPEPINAISLATRKHLFLAQGHRVDLYLTDTQRHLTTYTGHNRPVNSIVFMSTTSFVSCSDSLVFHDVSKETFVRRIGMGAGFRINDVVKMSEDIVGCCGEDNKVSIFDLRQNTMWKPVQVFEDAKDVLNGLSYADDGKILCCGGSDGKLLSYDLRKGLCVIDDLGGMITSVDCRGNLAALSFLKSDTSVKVWDVIKQGMVRQFGKSVGDLSYKIDTKISEDAQFTVSGSETGEVYLWELNSKSDVPSVLNLTEHGVSVGGGNPLVINTIGIFGRTVCCGREDGSVATFTVEL